MGELMAEWIDASISQPERLRPVLVCREKVPGQMIVEQGYRDVGDWWKVYGTRTKKVLYWRPMPAPPTQGADA